MAITVRRKSPLRIFAVIIVLGVAASSVVGMSCAPVQSVERVAVVDGVAYAKIVWRDPKSPAGGAYGLSPSFDPFFVQSKDGGYSWEKAPTLPDAAQISFAGELPFPKTLCRESKATPCFRIDGQERVEESSDGGQSWRIAWQVPANRQEYVDRIRNAWDITGCGRVISFRAVDAAQFLGPRETSVVVAMGGEGVTVRDSTGHWTRVTVLDARPTPWVDASPFAPMGLAPEIGIGVAIAIFTALVLLQWVCAQLFRCAPTSEAVKTVSAAHLGPGFWISLAFLIVLGAISTYVLYIPWGFAACLVLALILWSRTQPLKPAPISGWQEAGTVSRFRSDFWVSFALLLILSAILAFLYLAWDALGCLIIPTLLAITMVTSQIYVSTRKTLNDAGLLNSSAASALRVSWQVGLGVFIAWWLCFYAWTSGLPVNINNALVISIALTAIIVCGGVYRTYSLSRSAHLHRGDNTG